MTFYKEYKNNKCIRMCQTDAMEVWSRRLVKVMLYAVSDLT